MGCKSGQKRPELGEKELSSPSWQQQREESSVFNCLGPRIRNEERAFQMVLVSILDHVWNFIRGPPRSGDSESVLGGAEHV